MSTPRRSPLPWPCLLLLVAALACQTLTPAGNNSDATDHDSDSENPDARATATLDLSDLEVDDTTDAEPDDTADGAPSFSYDVSDAPGFLTPGAAAGEVALDEANLPFLGLFPALRHAAAPEWLSAPVRVTYRVESASIAQVEDAEGSAGAGYVQNDIVALEDELVVVNSKLYLDGTDGGVLPYGTFPGLGLPGVGDFWLNPEALTDAEQLEVDDLTVARVAETFAREEFDVMRFDYTPEDAHYTWKFDMVSGMLLEYRHDLGGEDDAARELTIITFVRFRQLDLPWAGEALPAWVCDASHLYYSGSFTTVIAGEAVPGLDYAVEVAFRACAAEWAVYDLTSQLTDLPSDTVTRLGGADQLFDALWLPPAAFNRLEDGQVLDEDPVTGAVTIAELNSDGTLTLVETNDFYEIALTYDTDGWLVALAQRQAIGLAENTVTLTLDDWD